MGNDARLEPTTSADLYYNYCWWPYQPVAPTAGKLRPVSLLFETFALAGLGADAFALVETLRRAIGPFRTVWGAKQAGGRWGWEFYFYDYKRRERDVSISRVVEALRPRVACGIPINEALPYFMFSIDVDADLAAGARALDVIHMYVGNPGSTVSSGIAYGVRAEGTTLENFYFFFDASRQLRDAAAKIACSARFDATRLPLDRVLWPELTRCHTICVANKSRADTVYFSGVDVAQLLVFLKRMSYPAGIVAFVERHRARLDHLLYDVGFDFDACGDALRLEKSGFYGVF